jgi:hypothetical protein
MLEHHAMMEDGKVAVDAAVERADGSGRRRRR